MLDGAKQPSLEFVSGSWLLWVVATQSVASVFASAATSGEPGPASAFSVIGFMTWGVGVILYLVLWTLAAMAWSWRRPARGERHHVDRVRRRSH